MIFKKKSVFLSLTLIQ